MPTAPAGRISSPKEHLHLAAKACSVAAQVFGEVSASVA